MTTDFYDLLLSDSALAIVLLGLFWYLAGISRGVRGIATWGVAHLLYTLGAAMIDGTARELEQAGDPAVAARTAVLGGVLACGGLVALAWSLIQFIDQRPLKHWEYALLPLGVGMALTANVALGGIDAQGMAMSAVEVGVMGLMIFHLRKVRTAPGRVPARLMMGGCAILFLLYGRDLVDALGNRYAPNETWVHLDLSIWFLLNFCMLMLTSFRASESLRQSAMFDPLTGALNRRGLQTELRLRRRRSTVGALTGSSAGHGTAVIALDLDHFKDVNDRYGHEAGDQVLQHFSDVVRACVRKQDLFARIGGEEFLVVLPDTDLEAAQRIAERILAQVAAARPGSVHPQIVLTTSIGLSHSPARDADVDALTRLADEALYAAKRLGRDRIEIRTLP